MKYRRAPQKDWLGGQNSDVSADSLSKNEGQLFSNLDLVATPNALVQRSGPQFFTSIGSTPEDPQFLVDKIFPFYFSSSVVFQMVSYTDTGVQKVGYFETNGTFNTLTSPAVITAPITDSVSFEGKVYFVNGTTKIYSWDGVAGGVLEGTAPLSSTPNIIEMFNNRAYYSGSAATPSRIFYSEPFTPVVFESPFLAFEDVSDNDNDYIEDMKMFGGVLALFKTRSIHVVIGSPPQEIRPIEQIGIGCIDKRTTQKTSAGIAFLSPRGVYLFTGRKSNLLSFKVDDELRSAYALSGDEMSSAYSKNVYYIFFKTTETTGINIGYAFYLNTLDFGLDNIPVSYLKDFELKSNLVLDDDTWYAAQAGTNNILLVSSNNKTTYYKNAGSPTELVISEVKTRWEDFGNETVTKELRKLFISTHSKIVGLNVKLVYEWKGVQHTHELTLSGSADAKWDEVNWDEFNWAPNIKSWNEIILPAGIYCNRAYLHLTSDVAEEFFTLDSIDYHYLLLREI